MAKGKKTGGRDFEPGNKHGQGRPALPKEIRELKKECQAEVEGKLIEFLRMSKGEVYQRMQDPETPMLDMMVGSIVTKAVTKGDHMRLNFLLDRLIGKVKDVSTDEPFGETNTVVVSYVPRSQRAANE